MTCSAAALRVTDLRCEYAVDPLGIDVAQPRLFWRVETAADAAADAGDRRQTAYQILVATSSEVLAQDRGDLWDSGRVSSGDTTHVRYAGGPLRSSQQVFWKVRAWGVGHDANTAGNVSPPRSHTPSLPSASWSSPATWTMGLLAPTDWKGRWICAPWSTESLLLRHEFEVRPGLTRALLHVSGLGHYEASLNGAKAGEDLFSPGWTNYHETTLYDTRDITALLRAGSNAIGLTLGNGMYHVVRRNRFAKFVGTFGPLRAIAHLHLEYTDGTTQVVGTDDTWHVHPGAITYNSIFGGEDYDARLEPAIVGRAVASQAPRTMRSIVPTASSRTWTLPDFDAREWARAVHIVRPAETLRGHSHASEPLRVIETRGPVSVRELKPEVVLYDFGQNASFMPRLRVSGPAGSTVRLTPGEVTNDDGTIDRGTMGGAHRGSAWWQYTKATDGEETWFPQFYYVGSRYLYVELFPATKSGGTGSVPSADDTEVVPPANAREVPASFSGVTLPQIASLEMAIVHAVAKPLGHFATSNPRLNAIRDLVRWAQRSNMVSVLTDCPHREKLGWIEQYHLNGPSIRYEFDVARIFTKGMHDMAAAQTEDGLIPNITPEFTEFKGAFRGAAEWGAAFILVPWQQYQFTGDAELMRTHYAAMKRYFAYLEGRVDAEGLLHDGLGDWYDLLLGKKGRAGLTPVPITATAFLFHDAQVLASIATVLGEANDAATFAAKAEAIRVRYNQEFFRADTTTYGTNSQASLALPLVMNMVEPEHRAGVLAALVRDVEERGYATAGDIGFRYLLRALADAGRSDVIYTLINQDEKPGYGYQIKQGATALTEAWDANRGSSHNHFMLGQVIEWFYHDLAGIAPDPAAPGFRNIIIRPQPVGDLTWVEATYESIRGPIAVRWDRVDGKFMLKVTIPANATATVAMPAGAGGGEHRVGSGMHVFEATWKP